MSEVPNFGSGQVEESEDNNFKGAQTFGKENFKSFNMLRQQDDFISKFESNLQKTLNLLHNQATPEQQSSLKEEDYQITETSQANTDFGKRGNVSDLLQKENVPNFANFVKNEEPRFSAIKDKLRDMKNRIHTHGDEKDYSMDKTDYSKRRIEELTRDNEDLRAELNKVKTDSMKKYEQLKKSNDELLVSYEERFKTSTKNLNEQHEQEIKELRDEIEQLKEESYKAKENFRNQKEKMGMTLFELEKEKQELISKMSQLKFKNIEFQSNSTKDSSSHNKDEVTDASTFVLEQVLKDKNELEKKYSDLFTSYGILLDHNKALSEKLEQTELSFSGVQSSKSKTKKQHSPFASPKESVTRKRSKAEKGYEAKLEDSVTKGGAKLGSPEQAPTHKKKKSKVEKPLPTLPTGLESSIHRTKQTSPDHSPKEKKVKKEPKERLGGEAKLESSGIKSKASKEKINYHLKDSLLTESKKSMQRKKSSLKNLHLDTSSVKKHEDQTMMIDDLRASNDQLSHRDRENTLGASMSTEHYMNAKESHRDMRDLEESGKKSNNKKNSSSSFMGVRRSSVAGKENKENQDKNSIKFSSAQKKSRVTTDKSEDPLLLSKIKGEKSLEQKGQTSAIKIPNNSLRTSQRPSSKDLKSVRDTSASMKKSKSKEKEKPVLPKPSQQTQGKPKKIPLYSKVNH